MLCFSCFNMKHHQDYSRLPTELKSNNMLLRCYRVERTKPCSRNAPAKWKYGLMNTRRTAKAMWAWTFIAVNVRIKLTSPLSKIENEVSLTDQDGFIWRGSHNDGSEELYLLFRGPSIIYHTLLWPNISPAWKPLYFLKASTCLPLRHLTAKKAVKSFHCQTLSSYWQWINICIHAPKGKEITQRENRSGTVA